MQDGGQDGGSQDDLDPAADHFATCSAPSANVRPFREL